MATNDNNATYLEVGDFYPIDGSYLRCIGKRHSRLDGFSFLFEGEIELNGSEIDWELVKLESEVL